MIRVMIVDDERHVREGLRDMVSWAQLGAVVCAVADDGETALETMRGVQPDILLTDVRMRHMNGIQLCQKARELYPDLKLVFLSGYDDTEYLKAALGLGAVDYVFKPVNIGEVEAVIRKVAGLVAEMRLERERSTLMQAMVRESLPLLREEFLLDWLSGRIDGIHTWNERVAHLGVELDGLLLPAVMRADDRENKAVPGIVLRRILAVLLPGAVLCARRRDVVALWGNADRELSVMPAVELCQQMLEEQYQLRLSVGIGIATADPMEIADCVNIAADALGKQFFQSEHRICFFEPEQLREALPAAPLPHMELVKIEGCLLAGDIHALNQRVGDLLERCGPGGATAVKTAILYLALYCARALATAGAEWDCLPLCTDVLESATLAQAKDALLSWLSDGVRRLQELKQSPHSGVIREVCSYIREHVGSDVSLGTLSQITHYTPTYLSAIFKSQTGSTISDFLLTCRLEKAMSLLRHTNDTVTAIAQSVGYSDPAHFSRLFKKSCGVTPNHYRKQYRG